MRQGEMHILNLLLCICIPVLFRCLYALLAFRNRLCHKLCTIAVIQSHALNLVCVDFIKQTELAVKIITGDIIFLNDIIIHCIHYLTDIQQFRIQLIHRTFDHTLCVRHSRLLHRHFKTIIQKQANCNCRNQRKCSKNRHND